MRRRGCLIVEEVELGPEHLGLAVTLYELGVCVGQVGRIAEAEDLLKRCLSIQEANLAPEDVEVAFTLSQLGVCVERQADWTRRRSC